MYLWNRCRHIYIYSGNPGFSAVGNCTDSIILLFLLLRRVKLKSVPYYSVVNSLPLVYYIKRGVYLVPVIYCIMGGDECGRVYYICRVS